MMQDQIDQITTRLDALETQQREHLALSQSVEALAKSTAENTKEVVDLMAAFRGAFIVMNFIGKAAKPVLWITGTMAAIAVLWAEFRGFRGK